MACEQSCAGHFTPRKLQTPLRKPFPAMHLEKAVVSYKTIMKISYQHNKGSDMAARKHHLLRLLLCASGLTALLACASGCPKSEQVAPKTKEKITFCQGGHVALLPQTALDKGYFEAEWLEATINKLGSGTMAMDTFLAGDCMFGIMAEPPIVKQAFDRDDFAIVASLATSGDFTRILARKDRGIASGKDLKGKRLGVNNGTTSQTFADLYLKRHGITDKDITIQFMDLKEMPAALVAGDIDAYSSSGTHFMEGKRQLGDNALVLNEPGLFWVNSYLVAKKGFISAKGDIVQRVLKAMVRAETEIAARPDEARKRLAGVWKTTAADAEFLLKLENHALALGPQQMDALEQQATWMLKTGRAKQKKEPDFRRIMDSAPLAAVKPGATNIGK